MEKFDQDPKQDPKITSLSSLIPEMPRNMDAITYAEGIGRVVTTILGWIVDEEKKVLADILFKRITTLLQNCPSSMRKSVEIEIAYIVKNLQEKDIILPLYPESGYLRWMEVFLERNGILGHYSGFCQEKGDISNIDEGLLRTFLTYTGYYAMYSYRGLHEHLTACIYVSSNPKGLQAVLGHMEDVTRDQKGENKENYQFFSDTKYNQMILSLMENEGKTWDEAHKIMDAKIVEMNILYNYFMDFLWELCYLEQKDRMTAEQRDTILLLMQSLKDMVDPEVRIPIFIGTTHPQLKVYAQTNAHGRTLH